MNLKDWFTPTGPARRFFVPEVVQTSAMDCGPATLKCLFEGFGIPISYDRLREACQTDVDGTSINAIEDTANLVGLEADQGMVPADYLLLSSSDVLPAIVVVELPNGMTHFVVVWSVHGPFVQIMDPAAGRRWMTQKTFTDWLHVHSVPIKLPDLLHWIRSDGFQSPVRQRLENLMIDPLTIDNFIRDAMQDSGWLRPAALDATIRMVDAVVRSKGIKRGGEAADILKLFYRKVCSSPQKRTEIVPEKFWTIAPTPANMDTNGSEDELLLLKGAVLIQISGSRLSPDSESKSATEPSRPLSPDLESALKTTEIKPRTEILSALRADGLFAPGLILVGLAIAAACVTIQTLLLRSLMEISLDLDIVRQRFDVAGAFFAFIVAAFLLEFPLARYVYRAGRHLETRLRIKFLRKIPELGDRYFRSRLTSDMTQRAHELRQLRYLPIFGAKFFRYIFQILFTGIGIVWLSPVSMIITVPVVIATAGFPLIFQPLLKEQDLRMRTISAGLSRYYFDALLGMLPIRTHSAARSVRNEHEGLLTDWARAAKSYYRLDVAILGVQSAVVYGFAGVILFSQIAYTNEPGTILLLLYWTLYLPVLGRVLTDIAQNYPRLHNKVRRIMEPLGAPTETDIPSDPVLQNENVKVPTSGYRQGMAIEIKEVRVVAGGHNILSGVDLSISAGEHIAVVGHSGAGKSTLVGLLLGWHRPIAGWVKIDHKPLEGRYIHRVRCQTAWVDPEIQIWNRTFIDNLRYGIIDQVHNPLGQIIEQADLGNTVKMLPNGMMTLLGEGGGLVSGGEGQRVRLARAMMRKNVRLAILDEPFRGLDRKKRQELLVKARSFWSESTMIFVSHDVAETRGFDRVCVIENGCVVEYASPDELCRMPDSRYGKLLKADETVRKKLWQGKKWTKLWIENGRLGEMAAAAKDAGKEIL